MIISELLNYGYTQLKEEGIESYAIDSQLILQKVLEKDKLFLLTNRNFPANREEEKRFFDLIDLRKNRMPVKYITGSCEFMGLDFSIKEGVLIPRPDTEILVEEVIKIAKERNYIDICDVCTGSGAIGISLSYFLGNIQLFCSDLSPIACSVAEENAKRLLTQNRVKIVRSDLLKFSHEMALEFDVIVSNPPYIPINVIESLMEDVKNYEPRMALDGGQDGLDFYREIVFQSLDVLKPGGLLAFEIGHDQGQQVKKIMESYGYTHINILKDLAGLDRVVTGFK